MEARNNKTIDLSKEDFKQIGHKLIDQLADFFQEMPLGKVTSGESPDELQQILEQKLLPETGADAQEILGKTMPLLATHSLFNGPWATSLHHQHHLVFWPIC